MSISPKLTVLLAFAVWGWALPVRAQVEAPTSATPASAPAPAERAAIAVGPASAATATAAAPFAWKLSGHYSIWGLNQRNFFVGRATPLNDADYVVQNFRLLAAAGTARTGGVLRVDVAQGWWGVDNSPDRSVGVTTDPATGKVTAQPVYNASSLFENKDTMYGAHFDHAYVWAELPWWPLRVQIGRQPVQLGNMLVLDQDLDAVRLHGRLGETVQVGALWAKMAEGVGAYRNPSGALMNDDGVNADADLVGLTLDVKLKNHRLEAFALRYLDRSPTETYLPQGLGYLHARFAPQVSEAHALGVRAAGLVALAQGLHYDIEVDALTGKDGIANTSHAGNLLDVNDGNLSGWNAWLALTQKLDVGMPVDVGLSAGAGSGDGDPMGGGGNLNRIQTMGFFALTNVWEDSIMPDVAGISPQGLGSPVSRGYRELENTTVAQLRLGVAPFKDLRIDTSLTWLQATEPVHGWDAQGPTAVTSRDLGYEIDANLTAKLWDGLTVRSELGWFVPGEAAALLINGTTAAKEVAWESKFIVQYVF